MIERAARGRDARTPDHRPLRGHVEFVFVGERRSATAIARGWTWRDGRLAASTLHRALRSSGLDPVRQVYVNLLADPPGPTTVLDRTVRRLRRSERPIVALGRTVSAGLTALGITHTAMVHPAARGTIRRGDNYDRHVAETLGRLR